MSRKLVGRDGVGEHKAPSRMEYAMDLGERLSEVGLFEDVKEAVLGDHTD
jgi:hypothetical protein